MTCIIYVYKQTVQEVKYFQLKYTSHQRMCQSASTMKRHLEQQLNWGGHLINLIITIIHQDPFAPLQRSN